MNGNRVFSASDSSSNDDEKFDSNANLEQAIYDVDERTPLISQNGNLVIIYSADDNRCISLEGSKRDEGQTDKDDSSVDFVSSHDVRLWKIARILGYISAVLLILLGVVCFIESARSESSSVFAFALFIRLFGSNGRYMEVIFDRLSPEIENTRIAVIIGCLFWLAATFILIRALLYLNDLDEQEEKESEILYILLGIGCGLQFFFFLTKTPIAVVLKSSALIADGVNSMAACILAITGIVASIIGESSEKLAIIDDLVGVLVSFFIAGYGTYLLFIVWVNPIASELFHIPEAPCARRSS